MEDGQKRKKAEYRSSLRSKTLIRNALVSLMQQKPFEKITITDIVREADINRGTFYAHYHDTTEVLDKIREDVVSDVLGAVKKMTPDEIAGNSSLFFQNICDLLEKNKDYYRMLLGISGGHTLFAEIKSSIVNYLLLSKAAQQYPDKDYLICALDSLVAGVSQAYLDVLTGKVDMTMDEATQLIINLSSRLRYTQK